jgi:hypothetical protein
MMVQEIEGALKVSGYHDLYTKAWLVSKKQVSKEFILIHFSQVNPPRPS